MLKITAACIFLLAANISGAAESPDLMAPVRQFFDRLNQGDMEGAMTACSSTMAITDEFPPFFWHGASACKDWLGDFGVFSKQSDLTVEKVTLGKASRSMADGDHAYVVAPVIFAFKVGGKHEVEKGAKVTAALTKGTDGWAITAWTWTTK